MKYDYINQSKLKKAFFDKKLDDGISTNHYGLCPIGNILQLSEIAKKENINWPNVSVEDALKKIYNEQYYIAEVDANCLAERMFEESSESGFDELFINSVIDPRFSINLLSLKPSASTWWEDDIYQEAIEETKNERYRM